VRGAKSFLWNYLMENGKNKNTSMSGYRNGAICFPKKGGIMSKDKKLEYIHHVLKEIIDGAILTEDSILIETAVNFIEDIRNPTENSNE
jgi:hypothetical protein